MIRKPTLLSAGIFTLASFSVAAQTVTDIDGNVYSTVTIGTQSWMAENLRTTHYTNGNSIPSTTQAINNDSTSKFQWAYQNDTSYVAEYGRLYTWYAATDQRGVCPIGWHLPSVAEWDTLITYLGGETVAGVSLKESGTAHWDTTYAAVTNSSGFSARGSGFRGNPSGFSNLNYYAGFWASNPVGIGGFARGSVYSLFSHNSACTSSVAVGNVGNCVRCIKDQAVGVHEAEESGSIRVYPNPAHDRLYIHSPQLKGTTISIFNGLGKRVYHHSKITANELEISLEQTPGVYFLVISSAEGVTQKRLVIL